MIINLLMNYDNSGLIGKNFINSLLNDTNAIMSSFVFWKKQKEIQGSINFFPNKMPFNDNYLIIAGIDEIVGLIKNFKFEISDCDFLKEKMPYLDNEYLDFLRSLQLDDIVLYGYDNGSKIDSNDVPILTLTGPLIKLKLLSYPITNLLSFSSLISTNSVRMKIESERNKRMNLIEMGLRRAQGPLAGLIASKYCYLSFDAVSNVLSGCLYNIPTLGTMAHAYVMSYKGIKEEDFLNNSNTLYPLCLEIREKLCFTHTNLSELYAFASFTSLYKDSSVLLVDTYDTIESGIKNSIIVGVAIKKLKNYAIKGVRLDSGDLAELSKKARILFKKYSEEAGVAELNKILISASNDINEKSIMSFNEQGHAIDTFGIGTHLVTCQRQPFLYLNIKNSLEIDENVIKTLEEKGFKILIKDNVNFNQTDLLQSKKLTENNINELKKRK
jgi:nicotinate phosphoribosyltransferase